MKNKHAARKIHARAPWVVHPEAYRAPQQAPQWPYESEEVPQGHTVSYPPRRPSARMQSHLDSVPDTHLVDPPRVLASSPTTAVFIDGAKVSIPSNWMVAFSSTQGKDTLYSVEPNGVLHVLTLDAHGLLRELAGLSDALVDDIFTWRFPEVRR